MSERQRHRDEVFLSIALTLAQLGTCDRKQVGAVITVDNRCVCWGYNGAPPGMPHCSENDHGWSNEWQHRYAAGEVGLMNRPHDWKLSKLREHGCINATHAEANALAFAARQGISTDNGTLYVTVSPCVTCARQLIAAGIKRVVFHEAYRDTAGVSLLQRAGIWCGIPGLGEVEIE